jgi:hypothetical protein
VLVIPGHERLEDLLGGQADLAGHRLGGEIVGIDLVFSQLERDAKAVEQADGVGLRGHRSYRRLGASSLYAAADSGTQVTTAIVGLPRK